MQGRLMRGCLAGTERTCARTWGTKMVPGTVLSFDRLICKASREEGRDERKVDSLSVDIHVIAHSKKRVNIYGLIGHRYGFLL